MASYTSTNRLTGLASGVDTDSYVEQLMYAASTKYYNYQRKVQKLQWQQEQYRSIISDIQSFQSKWLDVTSSTSLRMQRTFTKNFTSSVYSSSGSEVNSLSVSNISTAGSHSVTVKSTATTASIVGQTTVGGKLTGNDGSGSFTLSYDGTEATFSVGSDGKTKVGDNTYDDLQSALDATYGSGNVTATKDSSGNVTIASNVNGHTMTLNADSDFTVTKANSKVTSSTALSDIMDTSSYLGEDGTGTISFSINGTDISVSINESTTISDLVSAVNDYSDKTGVTMAYNSIAGAFTLESTDTGSTSKISISDESGLFTGLGITETSAKGTDAVLVVDGVETVSSSNSLKFDEFTVDISNATEGETYNVSSEQDYQAIYDMISEFIDDYNELITTINDKVTETRPKGTDGYYEPLTDDEKEEMTESEIEKWEEKAQQGLLYGDSLLTGFLSKMRSSIYATTATSSSGKTVGVYSCGITTTGSYTDGGLLTIDEDSLMDAITNDPDTIMNLFNDLGDSLNNIANTYAGTTGLLAERAGIENSVTEYDNYLYKQITDIQDRMSTELTRLQEKEERYYEMFSLMETYINDNNTTLNMLSSYFG